MTPKRSDRPLASFPWRSALAAALAISLLVGLPAFTDDTQLLRFDTAKPYVFIVLDTSASMGLEFDTSGDHWTPGGADGPGSRLYQAKQALYNTFKNVSDVHFGFASFNQDLVRAYQKHWIYYHTESLGDWPLDFPLADTDSTADDGDSSVLTRLIRIPDLDEDGDPILTDADGDPIVYPFDTREAEIDGHVLTFGAALAVGREAGTCAATGSGKNAVGGPLDLDDAGDLDQLQTFAIDGASNDPTRMWIEDGNQTYLLEVYRPGNLDNGNPNRKIGEDSMLVKLDLYSVSSCPFDPEGVSPSHRLSLTLRKDPHLSETFYIDSTDGSITDGSNDPEGTAQLWDHQDAVSEADFGSRPFTGEGWESNYDSGGVAASADETFDDELAASVRDRWCAHQAAFVGGRLDPSLCPAAMLSEVRPSDDTIFDSGDRRALDIGDMIPFHWTLPRRADFLDKLAPGYNSGDPDFRTASFFEDSAEVELSDGETLEQYLDDLGLSALPDLPLQLRNPSNRPLLALDLSPLARAINDMRCWYLGSRQRGGGQGGGGNQKCKAENPLVETGWEELACENDGQFGCRKPYLIIISDGEANTGGENPTADVSDLQNFSGIRTWVLNLGEADNCKNGQLHSIVQAAGTGQSTGSCINAESGSELRQELESILGQIRTEVRAFASAAVPTVQATVEQKVFLTNFTPFNDAGVWDGHIQAFEKPVPVVEGTGKPDTEISCREDSLDFGCFLWDAGANLLQYQYPPDRELGPEEVAPELLDDTDPRSRRVFYAPAATEPGGWALNRRLFMQPETLSEATQEVRFDLWDALGITYQASEPEGDLAEGETHPNQGAYDSAQGTLSYVLSRKSGTVLDSANNETDVLDFLLGDIFHSTPQVVGTPPNLFYLANDLEGEAGGDCTATNNVNKGYRCFWNRHRFRRKMLLVGANDGQFHAFDAGRFRGFEDSPADPDDRFDQGSASRAVDHFTRQALTTDVNPDGSFDNGTGLELFSYVPRPVLPLLHDQEAARSQHFFSVDGNMTVADVFVDPLAQEGAAFPLDADREWRTLVIGTLREGGAGYFALDVTQPDELTSDPELGIVPKIAGQAANSNDPATADYVPTCSGTSAGDDLDASPATAPTNCGTLPFPAVVWEFTDRIYEDGEWWWLDEDRAWIEDADSPSTESFDPADPPAGHGESDLGDSWSTPNVGRILICETSPCAPGDAGVVDRYVAIFGGGMDTEGKSSPGNPVRGNWLYMVDVETGQAIYKQRLDGAAPAEPAAIDTNGDGYFDRVYLGTLAGSMYRVDVGPVNGSYPMLEDVAVSGFNDGGTLQTTVPRIPRDVWVPVRMFDANVDAGFDEGGGVIVGDDGEVVDQDPSGVRPIYYRATVIYQAGQSNYVVAFGTGDRHDLWSLEDVTGRFYMLVDGFVSTADVEAPLNEADLARVETDGGLAGDANLLDTGGWYLVLDSKERVITEAFALSGITIFSAYEPVVYVGEDDTSGQDVGDGEGGEEEERVCGDIEAVDDDTVCSLRGTSNVYVVKTTNGDGLLFDEQRASIRSAVIPEFVTNPFTEQGQLKSSSGSGTGDNADELDIDAREVMESLKDLFPAECKFANYRIDIKTISSDTQIQHIASVPVCIVEHNWREF